jgi:hypothetical protein
MVVLEADSSGASAAAERHANPTDLDAVCPGRIDIARCAMRLAKATAPRTAHRPISVLYETHHFCHDAA